MKNNNGYAQLDRPISDAARRISSITNKVASYLTSIGLSNIYLIQASKVGRSVRTIGKPRIENYGQLFIGDRVLIRSVNVPVEICTSKSGIISIGNDCRINFGTSIGCNTRIEIGNRTRIGPYVFIMDTAFHDIYDRSIRPTGNPIHISEDAWIGAKSTILEGVRIGKASIIGANSVVTRDIDDYTVAAGSPAKEIYKIDPSQFKNTTDYEKSILSRLTRA